MEGAASWPRDMPAQHSPPGVGLLSFHLRPRCSYLSKIKTSRASELLLSPHLPFPCHLMSPGDRCNPGSKVMLLDFRTPPLIPRRRQCPRLRGSRVVLSLSRSLGALSLKWVKCYLWGVEARAWFKLCLVVTPGHNEPLRLQRWLKSTGNSRCRCHQPPRRHSSETHRFPQLPRP